MPKGTLTYSSRNAHEAGASLASGASVGQRWPIERIWTILTGSSRLEQVATSQLRGYRACGILGSAGLGKTCELQYLADLDRQDGFDVRIERLAVLGQTSDGLASQLRVLASAASENSAIYLDALDEVCTF